MGSKANQADRDGVEETVTHTTVINEPIQAGEFHIGGPGGVTIDGQPVTDYANQESDQR